MGMDGCKFSVYSIICLKKCVLKKPVEWHDCEKLEKNGMMSLLYLLNDIWLGRGEKNGIDRQEKNCMICGNTRKNTTISG